MKTLLTSILFLTGIMVSAQHVDIPVQINLKDGTTIQAKHFGQLKCGTDSYTDNYIYVRGRYMGTVTELNNYNEVQKIVFIKFSKAPVASIGNEKGTIRITKKNGQSFDLEDAEVYMTCYGVGDKYNTLIVQILNPITNEAIEKEISTKDIDSVVFK